MIARALPAWAIALKRRIDRGAANCPTMVRYAAERHARRAGKVLLAAGGQPGFAPTARLWPHACIRCRGWHLTREGGVGAAITAEELHEGVPIGPVPRPLVEGLPA